jgi:ABC-type transport system involved in cytochrome bd biosynthesis fused ATPase/permease subunit
VIAISLAGFTWGLERSWWSAEELMSLFVCVLMLYAPVKSLGRAQQQWVSGRAALERVSASLTEFEGDHLQPQAILLEGAELHLTPYLSLAQVIPLRGGTPRGAPMSLEISGGELIAIVGENGSGKSSLLLGLAGLIPVHGEIYWGERSGHHDHERNDHDQRQAQPSDPRRYLLEGVSWGGQPARLLTDDVDLLMNTREGVDIERDLILKQLNIDMTSLRAPRREVDIHPEELTLRYWDWFQGLSSGERQRLQLATLLAQPTRLLLLDEPEAHLDEAGVRALISLLRDRDESRIVIIATHSDSLRDACDRVVDLSALSR